MPYVDFSLPMSRDENTLANAQVLHRTRRVQLELRFLPRSLQVPYMNSIGIEPAGMFRVAAETC